MYVHGSRATAAKVWRCQGMKDAWDNFLHLGTAGAPLDSSRGAKADCAILQCLLREESAVLFNGVSANLQ
jgi:hypothetical protein